MRGAFDTQRAVVAMGDGVVARFPGILCVARCADPGPVRHLLELCASIAGSEPGHALARGLATWLSGPDAPGPALRFGTLAAAGDELAVFLVGAVHAWIDGRSDTLLSGAYAAIGTDRLMALPATSVTLSIGDLRLPPDVDDVHDLRAGVVEGAGVVLHAAAALAPRTLGATVGNAPAGSQGVGGPAVGGPAVGVPSGSGPVGVGVGVGGQAGSDAAAGDGAAGDGAGGDAAVGGPDVRDSAVQESAVQESAVQDLAVEDTVALDASPAETVRAPVAPEPGPPAEVVAPSSASNPAPHPAPYRLPAQGGLDWFAARPGSGGQPVPDAVLVGGPGGRNGAAPVSGGPQPSVPPWMAAQAPSGVDPRDPIGRHSFFPVSGQPRRADGQPAGDDHELTEVVPNLQMAPDPEVTEVVQPVGFASVPSGAEGGQASLGTNGHHPAAVGAGEGRPDPLSVPRGSAAEDADDVGPGEVDPGEYGAAAAFGPSEGGPGEDGPGEGGPGEDGPGEGGSGEYGSREHGVAAAYGPGEAGPGERGPGAGGAGEYGPEERGPAEHGPADYGPGEHGPAVYGPGEHSPGEYGAAAAYGPGEGGPGARRAADHGPAGYGPGESSSGDDAVAGEATVGPGAAPERNGVAATPSNATGEVPIALAAAYSQQARMDVVAPAEAPGTPGVPEPAAADGGPQVRGYVCEQGHLNDPRSPFCVRCGNPIDNRTSGLVTGPRPSLGRLVFDDGVTYMVDDGYLVGRMPEADDRVNNGALRPIIIEDRTGSVSRVHAEITVSGWDVMLLDAGSRNGTFVAGPEDAGWSPLTPRRGRRLLSGTRVRLGGRTFVFESAFGGR